MKLRLAIYIAIAILAIPMMVLTMTIDGFASYYLILREYNTTHNSNDEMYDWQFQTFTPSVTHYIGNVHLSVKRAGTITETLQIQIESTTNGLPDKNILSTGSFICTSIGTSDFEEITITLDTPVLLNSGTKYAIVISNVQNDTSCLYKEYNSSSVYANGNNGYGTGTPPESGITYHAESGDWWFKEYSTFSVIEVLTLSPHIENGKPSLRGYVIALQDNTSGSVSFEYGPTSSYGSETTSENFNWVEPNSKIFSKSLGDFPFDAEFHYRIKLIVGSAIYYGEDKDFSMIGNPIVVVLKAEDVSFETCTIVVLLKSIGNQSDIDLSIDYGTTHTMDSNTVIDTALTVPDIFELEMTGLTSNTTYYYRAKAVGDTLTGYSEILSFRTIDSGKIKAVNTVNTWLSNFGFTGSGAWWIIVLIAIAITWLLLHNGKIQQLMAMVISFLIVGAGIVFNVLDVWLIILLALAGGVSAYSLIFKKGS